MGGRVGINLSLSSSDSVVIIVLLTCIISVTY